MNRCAPSLSDSALAYLALDLRQSGSGLAGRRVDRASSARGPRPRRPRPGGRSRLYWDNSGRSQAIRGAAETTALVTLAYARVRPQAPELDGAVDWLLAHRAGTGWQPHKAKGPALAALASYYGRAQACRGPLQADGHRQRDPGRRARCARLGRGPGDRRAAQGCSRSGKPNRIRFEMEGRGRFGYAVTLAGFTREFRPDQDRGNRVATIDRRVYLPRPPELDGKVLAGGLRRRGQRRARFENLASQVALGGRARVAITAWRNIAWQRRPNGSATS